MISRINAIFGSAMAEMIFWRKVRSYDSIAAPAV